LGSQKDKNSVELWWSNNAREASYWSWVWASPVQLWDTWYWCKSCCSDARNRDACMRDDERGGFGSSPKSRLWLHVSSSSLSAFLLLHARMASRKMTDRWRAQFFFFHFLFFLGSTMADPTWQAVGTPSLIGRGPTGASPAPPLGLNSGPFIRSQGSRMGYNIEPSLLAWRVQFCYTLYPSPSGRTVRTSKENNSPSKPEKKGSFLYVFYLLCIQLLCHGLLCSPSTSVNQWICTSAQIKCFPNVTKFGLEVLRLLGLG